VIQGAELGSHRPRCIVSDYEQNSHYFGLLHSDLLNSLDIAHPIMNVIDYFDVLEVQDSVLGVAKMFRVVSKAFIMLLLDGLQGFSYRRTLICALRVSNEHGT
jgi:hypothetical protein